MKRIKKISESEKMDSLKRTPKISESEKVQDGNVPPAAGKEPKAGQKLVEAEKAETGKVRVSGRFCKNNQLLGILWYMKTVVSHNITLMNKYITRMYPINK